MMREFRMYLNICILTLLTVSEINSHFYMLTHLLGSSIVQLTLGAFKHSVLRIREIYGLYGPLTKNPHFPKHKYPIGATQNAQTHLKSTVHHTTDTETARKPSLKTCGLIMIISKKPQGSY